MSAAIADQPKRGRGRPRKNPLPGNGDSGLAGSSDDAIERVDGADGNVALDSGPIDPAAVGTEPDAGSGNSDGGNGGTRRRGRPPGSGKSGKASRSSLDIDGISAILFSSHQMLAHLTKVQELGINEIQAKTLAGGIANVARHYDLGGVNQKTLDWLNLGQIVVITYYPLVARAKRASSEKRAARQQATSPGNGGPTTPGAPQFAPGAFIDAGPVQMAA